MWYQISETHEKNQTGICRGQNQGLASIFLGQKSHEGRREAAQAGEGEGGAGMRGACAVREGGGVLMGVKHRTQSSKRWL